MLIKYARSSSAAEVISGGESSTKIAGIAPQVREFITGIKPDDNTYMLSTAMSYSEFFGPNSNNDYYGHNPHLGYNGLLHAWEDIGKSVDNDRRKGREWSHGYPCFYDATVYAHHRNTDPKTLGFGDIIFAFANPAMRRIELVHRIFDAIARERGHGHFLDRLDRGERVDTSMGCFLAGAQVTMADGTRKPIEEIVVGDRVRTHTGAARVVTETHVRQYTGPLYTIVPQNEDALISTVEHPFFVSEQCKKHKMWLPECTPFGWVPAKELMPGHALSHPIFRKTATAPPRRGFARVLGYYLADGHLARDKRKQVSGLEFCVNKKSPLLQEADDLARYLKLPNPPSRRPHPKSEKAEHIAFYGKGLAQEIEHWAGSGALTKRLSEDVFSWPARDQLELLGAWINGDGHQSKAILSLSTANSDLAHQARELLFGLGIPSSLATLRHKVGTGKHEEPCVSYVLSIGKEWEGLLVPYCYKASHRWEGRRASRLKQYGDTWAIPIRSVEVSEGTATVYNFEVDGDQSYLVNGVAAHNCKVPFDLSSTDTDWDRVRKARDRYDPKRHKHWGDPVLEEHVKNPIPGVARTRAEYGPDMRSRAGKILPDGRQVFVYNDIPRFFDNSLVIVGADRTAKSMWHLPAKKPHNAPLVMAALEALSGLKLGEMTKRIGPRPGIRGEVLALAPHHDKRAALATLAHVGICCTPEEFSLLVLGAPVSFKTAHAIDYVLSPDPLDVSTALVPRIYAGTAPVDLPVKVASGELEQSLGAMYTGYRLGAIRNATALFSGPIKIASSRGGFLLQESTVIDWLSPVGIAPGETHMALMSAVTSSKDLEKISTALDAVIRTKKTSMWAALDEVAELTAYM